MGYMQILTFHGRDLSIRGFWHPRQVLVSSSGTKRRVYEEKPTEFPLLRHPHSSLSILLLTVLHTNSMAKKVFKFKPHTQVKGSVSRDWHLTAEAKCLGGGRQNFCPSYCNQAFPQHLLRFDHLGALTPRKSFTFACPFIIRVQPGNS